MATPSKGVQANTRVLAAKRKPAKRKPSKARTEAAKKTAARTAKRRKEFAAKAIAKTAAQPADRKPAAHKLTARAKSQLAELAALQKRADSAGDAGGLVGPSFNVASDLVEAIDVMRVHIGVASASLYRELRAAITDIIKVIESREEMASSDLGRDRLAELLGAHDDDA